MSIMGGVFQYKEDRTSSRVTSHKRDERETQLPEGVRAQGRRRVS